MKAYRQYLTAFDLGTLTLIQMTERTVRAEYIRPSTLKRLKKFNLVLHRGKVLYITVQGLAAMDEAFQNDGYFTPYPHDPADEPEPDEPMEQASLFADTSDAAGES